MNRRAFGSAENIFGIAGVSEKGKKKCVCYTALHIRLSVNSSYSLERAEDFCRKRKPEKALPYLYKALEENPDNLDAYIQLAFLFDLPECLKILAEAEQRGRAILQRDLDPDCFEDGNMQFGQFWGLLGVCIFYAGCSPHLE